MLVQFTIENFRSIHQEATFSMQTAPYLKKLKKTNTFMTDPVNLLKSAIIFGANGSGKTNLFKAAQTLRGILLNSKRRKNSKLPFEPFKMIKDYENSFTTFEIILLLEGSLFKYTLRYNDELIQKESLVKIRKSTDEIIFDREFDFDQEMYIYELSNNTNDLIDITRNTTPYLSILSDFNDILAMDIISWFEESLVTVGADFETSRYRHIYEKLENKELKEKLLMFLKVADFNIVDIELRRRKHKIPDKVRMLVEAILEEDSDKDADDYMEILDVFTIYNTYDANLNIVDTAQIHADSYESRGTNKMILISLILLDAIENGKTLLIDEFDNAFHVAISKFLLKVFNTPLYNSSSQFILNTHDLSLLNSEILRVDQIWFVEKDRQNSSEFYSLYDFNETYNRSSSDMSFANEYIKGKFGAIPIVNESTLLKNIFAREEGVRDGVTD
ncbi:AAA family ATPase [Bacillus bombysepticus]